MRQRRLAGTHTRTAADQRLGRDRVVGRAERPLTEERRAPVEQPRDRVDAADLDRLVVLERRHQVRGATQEERLADPGRPAQRQVVVARQRDLQPAARQRLARHLGEVRAAPPWRPSRGVAAAPPRAGRARRRGGRPPRPAKRRRGLAARSPPRPLRSLPRPRSATGCRRRTTRPPAPSCPGTGRTAPSSPSSPTRAVSRSRSTSAQLPGGGQDPHRDRQVVAGAVLGQVCRREVDGDPPRPAPRSRCCAGRCAPVRGPPAPGCPPGRRWSAPAGRRRRPPRPGPAGPRPPRSTR